MKAKKQILQGYDFPNLPFMHDKEKDVKLTHTMAILSYIGRKYNLAPDNYSDEQVLCDADVIREEAKDLYAALWPFCYDRVSVYDLGNTHV